MVGFPEMCLHHICVKYHHMHWVFLKSEDTMYV